MDSRKHIEDYRHIIISKWSTSNIEGFKKPTLLDLDKQSNYYIKLIDIFFPDNRKIDILEIGCGWGGFIYTSLKS